MRAFGLSENRGMTSFLALALLLSASAAPQAGQTPTPASVQEMTSPAADKFNGQRLIAQFWDDELPLDERLQKCSAPAGWPQLGRQALWAEMAPPQPWLEAPLLNQ